MESHSRRKYLALETCQNGKKSQRNLRLNGKKNILLNFLIRGGNLTDAPKDGKVYGRKDGAWEEVSSGANHFFLIKEFSADSSTKDVLIIDDAREYGELIIFKDCATTGTNTNRGYLNVKGMSVLNWGNSQGYYVAHIFLGEIVDSIVKNRTQRDSLNFFDVQQSGTKFIDGFLQSASPIIDNYNIVTGQEITYKIYGKR